MVSICCVGLKLEPLVGRGQKASAMRQALHHTTSPATPALSCGMGEENGVVIRTELCGELG
jgi:hypothetical protein